MFRKRVPGVGSGDRKSAAVRGSQSDWRHDQTVSSTVNCYTCILQNTYLLAGLTSIKKQWATAANDMSTKQFRV